MATAAHPRLSERSPLPRRAWLLLPAGASLLAGLNAALLLLEAPAPVTALHLPARHGMLMVLGFLGTLVSLERAVALRRTWGYAAPVLLGLGGLALAAPLPLRIGQVLLVDGAVAFVALAITLWRRQHDDAVGVEVLATVHALAAALLWLRVDVAAALPFLTGFVVLTIAAERVELARIHLPAGATRTLLGFAAAYATTATATLLAPTTAGRALGVVLLGLSLWLARHDIARRLIRSTGLPRFSAAAMLAGYCWLAVAAVTWIVVGRATSLAGYDVLVHATFLGFAMSMVLAHAAIILPAVIRRPVPYRPAFWIPLVALHATLLVRVGGAILTEGGPVWVAGAVGTVVAVLLIPLTALTSALSKEPV